MNITKKAIKASDMVDYDVVVNFGGYIGADETYSVIASSPDEAIDQAISEAEDDLEVVDCEYFGDGDYMVTIGFGGFVGVENSYDVTASSKDEACKEAFAKALLDLEGEIESSYYME